MSFNYILSLIFFLYSLHSFSQIKEQLDESFKKVSGDSTLYFKVCPDSTLCKVYYLTGQLYSEEPTYMGQRNGLVTFYYLNGQKEREQNYHQDRQEGAYKIWYENGQQKEEGRYFNNDYEPLNMWDSTGKSMIINGTGKFISYYSGGQVEREGEYIDRKKHGRWIYYYISGQKMQEGLYNNGKKIDVWNGWYLSGKISYKEKYKKGKLVEGSQFTTEGKVREYTSTSLLPEYPGGRAEINKKILKEVGDITKYLSPGEHKIVVNFTVTKEGEITEFSLRNHLHPVLDKKVLDVFVKSSPWFPAMNNGEFLQMRFTIPISFKVL